MIRITTSHKLKELYEKAFTKGFDDGRKVGFAEGHNQGVVMAGYNAVKEAEKILNGHKEV
jgi:flagellar biosynthesis/type III secretory pathway protein FliH